MDPGPVGRRALQILRRWPTSTLARQRSSVSRAGPAPPTRLIPPIGGARLSAALFRRDQLLVPTRRLATWGAGPGTLCSAAGHDDAPACPRRRPVLRRDVEVVHVVGPSGVPDDLALV